MKSMNSTRPLIQHTVYPALVLAAVLFFVASVVAFVVAVTGLLTTVAAQDSSPPDTSLALVVEIGSRLYPDWSEEQEVPLDQFFYLGDTEFVAKIVGFVPDFRISDSGEILNYSDELKNPAAHVIIYQDTTASDSTWAFLNFPPHFSPRLFFTFKLKEIRGYNPPEKPPSAAEKREEENDG
jgi:hypothetical protein